MINLENEYCMSERLLVRAPSKIKNIFKQAIPTAMKY